MPAKKKSTTDTEKKEELKIDATPQVEKVAEDSTANKEVTPMIETAAPETNLTEPTVQEVEKQAYQASSDEKPISEVATQPTPVVQPVVTPQTVTQQNAQPATTTPLAQTNTGQITAPVVNQSELATSDEGLDIHEEGPDRKMTRWILIIVVLVLLIIAMVGSIFYYYTQYRRGPVMDEVISPQPAITASPTPSEDGDETTENLESVQESDSIEALGEDIENTVLDNLDAELDDIDEAISTQ